MRTDDWNPGTPAGEVDLVVLAAGDCAWTMKGRPTIKKMTSRNILILLWDRHFIKRVMTSDVERFLIFSESDARGAFGRRDKPCLFALRIIAVNFPVCN